MPKTPYDPAMGSKLRPFAIITVALAALIAPNVALSQAPTAAALLGLGGLSLVLATLSAGLRIGALVSLGLGIASGIAVAGTDHTIVGVVVMASAAVGLGISARWHWNKALVTVPITLAFVVAEDPSQDPLNSAASFGAAMAIYGLLISVLASLLRPRDHRQKSNSVRGLSSWSRTWGYVVVLVVTTVASSTIALTLNWGHTGGWLMMTPFIVIQPYVQDGWRKSLNRVVGTVGGFLIAYLAADSLGSGTAVTVVGVIFGVLAVTAMIEKWNYAIYALFLTPAIVILESIGRPVQTTADNRLIATVVGVALALVAMALATPIYQREASKDGLQHY